MARNCLRELAQAKIVEHNKASVASPCIHFFANCVFGDHVAGGDIHFFHMAEASLAEGYPVHFFGGHALQQHLQNRHIAVTQTLTDKRMMRPIRQETLEGQCRLFWDYLRRYCQTLRRLNEIKPEDTVYAVTDYWFDVLPVVFSRAKKKLMILGMDAPTLREIIFRTRPDVTASRLTSIYYWASQNLSLRLFRRCHDKRLFYVHPDMRARLLRMGYQHKELVYISNGMNRRAAEAVPDQTKEFDVIWVGRMHRQKGIEDLLATLAQLSRTIKNFRVVLVGRLDELKDELQKHQLTGCVTLAGMVSEGEKFRLFKASRVFLMPSRQESWGIVIAEALACQVPVVAYDLPAYRPIFGSLVHYVPAFDLEKFKATALETVERARRGETALDAQDVAELKSTHSWEAAGNRFTSTIASF